MHYIYCMSTVSRAEVISSVSGLSNDRLLEQTGTLARLDHQVQVFVIDHLCEIEARKLQGGDRHGVPARAGAAQGTALPHRSAHDAGAARRTVGSGRAGSPRPESSTTQSAHRQPDRRRRANFGAENSQANWQMTGGASPLDGRSSHSTTPREPCVGVGDGTDEASVAVRVGRVSSVEREMIWSAETLRRVEGNTGCDVRVRSSRAPRRLRPLARMYVICRDLGDLRVALVGRHQGRKGKADSRSRRCTTRRSLTRA